jgi:hypothetical protein
MLYTVEASTVERQKKPKGERSDLPLLFADFRAFTARPKKDLALSRYYLRWSRDQAQWFPEDKMLILSAAVSRLAGYVNSEEGGVAPAAVHGVRGPCAELTY